MAKTKSKPKHKASATSSGYFGLVEPLRFEGERFMPSVKCPLGYRWYDANRKVLGKRMADWLRLSPEEAGRQVQGDVVEHRLVLGEPRAPIDRGRELAEPCAP